MNKCSNFAYANNGSTSMELYPLASRKPELIFAQVLIDKIAKRDNDGLNGGEQSAAAPARRGGPSLRHRSVRRPDALDARPND